MGCALELKTKMEAEKDFEINSTIRLFKYSRKIFRGKNIKYIDSSVHCDCDYDKVMGIQYAVNDNGLSKHSESHVENVI